MICIYSWGIYLHAYDVTVKYLNFERNIEHNRLEKWTSGMKNRPRKSKRANYKQSLHMVAIIFAMPDF